MTPDTTESRLNRLERENASLSERVGALGRQVQDLLPLATSIVRLEGVVNGVKQDVADVGDAVKEVRSGITADTHRQAEERRSLRLALLGLAGTILASLVAALVTIIASGAHP